MNATTQRNKSSRYGITERKKTELDQLANQVLDAQHEVDQVQAVVNSLTEKSQKFQVFLTEAEASRAQALNNKVMIDTVVQNARALRENANIAFGEIVLADGKTKELAVATNKLINKLIYTAEVINKLSNYVIRKKALNPLISDELINVIGTAGKDANNAVALMLVALNSVFAAQATALESEASLTLAYTEAIKLYDTLTGVKGVGTPHPNPGSLKDLLYRAYENAQKHFTETEIANKDTSVQLFNATADLTKAQVKLKSLQSALAAANAAAFAS